MVDAEVSEGLGHVADGGAKQLHRQGLLRGLGRLVQLALVLHPVQQDVGNLHHENCQVNSTAREAQTSFKQMDAILHTYLII